MRHVMSVALLLAACGGGDGGSGGGGDGGGGPGGDADLGRRDAPEGTTRAAALAAKLGRDHFLVGMGNDLAGDHDQDGAYTLGVSLDLHYAYLVGLPGQGGWPDWNADGSFVNILADAASRHGTVPMFTLYAMASIGDGNLSGLASTDFMTPYWAGTRLLFQRLGMYDAPAVVHHEPDFWSYAQQQSGGTAAGLEVRVSQEPECTDLADDLSGLGLCTVRMARMYAPKTVVGFHASGWAGSPEQTITFLSSVGATQADFVATDLLDRDAGCFEAHVDPNCQRESSGVYWDETNTTPPHFHDAWAWAAQIGDGLGLPMMWWQLPFGVPSDTPGGTAGHYRDNRVRYMFGHVDELVAAGGVGMVFGVGAGNQTFIDTDGGQFRDAVTTYFAAPTALR